jgi:glycerophosphoryl diester phosphodiesterase
LLTESSGIATGFAELLTHLPISGLFPEKSQLSAPQIERLHRRGCFMGTWTVNTEAEVTRATRLGADVLIGDNPRALRQFVG